MRILRAWWNRIVGALRPGSAEREFADELQSHIDLHVDDNIRAGMPPDEARRQALAKLGSVAAAAEAHRDRRGLPALGALMFDLKLGGRMLLKYPGLTIIAGFAMAFAIAVGAVIIQMLSIFVYPTLPLPQGDRIVQIRNWDLAKNAAESRALYDFAVWQRSLQSVTELGAWRNATRNLTVNEGDSHAVLVAEITSSAFHVADGRPLMGRVLTPADERPEAPPVAVIGYGIWQTRFAADPSVIGKAVQLGADHVTVVGVMREGFAFPISHEVWTPLRAGAAVAPRSGPAISVFGMLATGASLDTAQAELTGIGQRIAAEQPATHEHLQPRVSPYAEGGGPSPDDAVIVASIYSFVVLLLILICSNIALLYFARAATREREFTVRTALGASRSRIVAQMFVEALVLGGVSAVVGLVAAQIVLSNWGLPFLKLNMGRLPFWYDVNLSPATLIAGLGLTILGSGIAGVIPALKVTRGMNLRLKQATAGAGGLQFGGIWTLVIIVQVAVTVAFPALVYQEQWQLRRVETFDAGFPTNEYLAARIQLEDPRAEESVDARSAADRVALSARLEDLRRRIAAEPGVAGVTFAESLPTSDHPSKIVDMGYDVDAASTSPTSPKSEPKFRRASVAAVDPSYFDALSVRVLAGRSFTTADAAAGARVAIVDQGFVDQVLEGRNAVGQHVRFRYPGPPPRLWSSRNPDEPAKPAEWYEVIGVVRELGTGAPTQPGRAAGFYIPAPLDVFDDIHMLVHVRDGDPLTFAPKMRELTTAVDPSVHLADVQRLNDTNNPLLWMMRLWLRITVGLSSVALALSLAGIYAVMSFTVARRTRDIGVRVALGASRRRVVAATFRRPLWHVTLGIVAGTAMVLAVAELIKYTEFPGSDTDLTLAGMLLILGHGTVMLAVCMLGCIVPTRRALKIEPTIALRAE
jgi:putative ABC transport system permease protein